jgi:uncharacterized protein YndB with AHSA1/START domain
MGFSDRIERTVELAHPPATVWAALTTAEGLSSWFGRSSRRWPTRHGAPSWPR